MMLSNKRNTAHIAATICIIVALPIHSHAQTVRQLSVDQLFELGVTNSLQVQSSRTNLDIARSDLADKKSGMLPDINFGIVGGYIGEPTVFTQGLSKPKHPTMPDWSQNYNVEVVQPIYQGGRTKYSIQKADLQRQIAELGIERDISQIKLILMSRYLDLFGLYKQQQVFETGIEQARQRLHDIRIMERNGMVTSSDVLRSELQLSNYELSLTQTKNDIQIVSQQLDIALGIDENLTLIPDTTLLDNLEPIATFSSYIDMAYAKYPELRIAQTSIEMARKESRIVRSDFLPRLSLRASNIMARPITSSSPVQDLYANNWNVGLTLSYNLSSLYHNKHKADMSQYRIRLQNLEQQRTEQEIRANVKSSYIKHNEAIERISTLTISVEQANENYRIVLNKYRNHIAILTDLLDASTLQLNAQLQLTNAKTEAVYTYYQLLRSSGNL